MQTIAERLEHALKESGMTASELARTIRIRPQAVSQWISGSTKSPSATNLLRAAKVMGVDPDWLIEGKTRRGAATARVVEPLALPGSIPVVGHHDEDATPAGFIALQAITLEVGAGHRLTEGQEPETKARLYSLESLQRQRLRPSDLVAYKVRGNSMEPYLFDGDWVVIDRSRKMPPSIAKPLDCRCNTFVFRYEDGIMVKMLQTLPDGGFNVVSLNRAEHKEFAIPASSVDRLEVYGKVVDRSGWSV